MLTAGPPEPQLRDVICLQACTIFFFVRTFFYMNIQAEISQNFKNTLRTLLGWESIFISLFLLVEKYKLN